MTGARPPKSTRYGALEILLGCLMLALVAVVFIQVVLRYATYQPLAWTEEVSRFVFIWACMIGAAVGCHRGAHFAVTFLLKTIPGTPGRLIRCMIRLLEAGFYAVLTWAGVAVAAVAHRQHSIALDWPMSIPYSVVALSGLLMCAFSLRQAGRELRKGPGR